MKSHTYKCTSGVPQGGNLAPLLFLLYVNDIPKLLKHSKCLLFGDDLNIFKNIKTTVDTQNLLLDLRTVVNWSKNNNLPLNAEKCKVISFTRNKKHIQSTYDTEEEQLERVKEVRDLGVVMESGLNYSQHLQRTVMKAKRNAGLVKRFSNTFKGPSVLRLLYLTLVRPHLEFANIIWGFLTKAEESALEVIQKRFLKFLYYKNFTYYDHSITYPELASGYEINTLQMRRDLYAIRLLYNLIRGQIDSPGLLFEITIYVPPRIGRPKGLFSIPRARTNTLTKSPLVRNMKLYNKLIEINSEIDIFFDPKHKFEKK